MKNDLLYQSTDYTCAPTTMVNALRYLYDRDEIRPDVLWEIFRGTLDMYGSDGRFGGEGTSPDAMLGLAATLNMYGNSGRFPIHVRLLRGEDALAGSTNGMLRREMDDAAADVPGQASTQSSISLSRAGNAVGHGDAAQATPHAVGVARIWSNRMNGHYALVTGFGELPDGRAAVCVFDPFKDSAVDGDHVRRIDGKPARANRIIDAETFDSGERVPYALVNDRYGRRVIIIARGESA
ncbi:hypothetical protein [Bifidobacterium sp.]|uniref:hypothetical protein n=1 Tax=Bifidobacterium sp. TaxID=41200 RepID=UPI0025BD29F5|nr:hypothetical protein [Bifidobacterium sp.]MCH4209910.1 hypothetical protein [Bifidobacterium sp.]MCI1224867.1 hypothetical protein [Bifidobacterium sp.]